MAMIVAIANQQWIFSSLFPWQTPRESDIQSEDESEGDEFLDNAAEDHSTPLLEPPREVLEALAKRNGAPLTPMPPSLTA